MKRPRPLAPPGSCCCLPTPRCIVTRVAGMAFNFSAIAVPAPPAVAPLSAAQNPIISTLTLITLTGRKLQYGYMQS